VPRSAAPRSRSGPRQGARATKGSRSSSGRTVKGRRRSRSGRAFRAALLVVLITAGVVVTWPAAEKHLSAFPFLQSVIAGFRPAAPTWPLTGVPADAVADRPALAVKIENSVDARPQTGLTAADMV
jgi:DUF3048 family protein